MKSLSTNRASIAQSSQDKTESNSISKSKELSQPISFTLRNTSNESTPLIIPSVMRRNLSPDSISGVSLKIGQEIQFRVKGKNYILLTVND
ncbi:MAG: hypothetical protein ACI9O4_000818 [Chitinophagales bacterium]|jgi:hypothetical protein